MLGSVGQLWLAVATGVSVRFVWGEVASLAALNAHAITVSSGDS